MCFMASRDSCAEQSPQSSAELQALQGLLPPRPFCVPLPSARWPSVPNAPAAPGSYVCTPLGLQRSPSSLSNSSRFELEIPPLGPPLLGNRLPFPPPCHTVRSPTVEEFSLSPYCAQ